MEKILIDGYNLLHKDETLRQLAARDLQAARDRLVATLAAHRRGRTEMVVVFDGRGPGSVASGPPGIKVLFSPAGRSADHLILQLVENERRRSRLTVVTSDAKDIGRAARAEGVKWISSEAFLRRLAGAGARPAGASEKPESSTPEEVEYWRRQFGGDRKPDRP